MTTTQAPTDFPTQTQSSSAGPSAGQPAGPSEGKANLHPSVDIISQMVAVGLAKSFDALKEKFTESIAESGEQYLVDAVDKMKDSAGKLVHWSKQNPVKTAVAVAAVLAVSAFLISTMKGKTTEAAANADKETPPLTTSVENSEAAAENDLNPSACA